MTFRYRNSSGASTFDIDLGTSAVRLGSITSGFADSAELAEPAQGGLDVDDPGGALDLLPLQYIVVVESEAPAGDDVVHIGLIGEEAVARGDASRPSLRVGADRVWSLTLSDPNEFLGLRLLHSFSRPAETAAARLTALLAVSNCPVHDHGLVVYPTHAMDKCDYTWQSFQQVLSDISAQAGYNYFAYYSQSTGDFGLFFDSPDSTAYTSTAKISNVLADLGAGVYAPLEGSTTLTRSPSRIASTAVVQYAGGYQTYYDATTADLYTAVDRVAPTSNVKTAAKALAVAMKYQAASSSPSDRITTTVRLPRANVNDIRAGHRMQVTYSHLPGYSSPTWVRVMRRTVLQPEETDETYQVTLELTPQAPPVACSASLSGVVTAHVTDHTGAAPYSVTVVPTLHSVVAAGFVAGGTGMSLSGATATISAVRTYADTAHGWAVGSGSLSVTASWTWSRDPQAAVAAAFQTTATSPVQVATGGWANGPVHAVLASPPTPGNLLIAVATLDVNDPTTATGSVVYDAIVGPHTLDLLDQGIANGMHAFGGCVVAVFAACAGTGWGTDWRYGTSGAISNFYALTVMEWAM